MSTIDAPEENSENNVPLTKGEPGDEDWMVRIYFDAVTPVAVQVEKVIPWFEASLGMETYAHRQEDGVLLYIEFSEKPEEDPPEPERIWYPIQTFRLDGGSSRPTTRRPS